MYFSRIKIKKERLRYHVLDVVLSLSSAFIYASKLSFDNAPRRHECQILFCIHCLLYRVGLLFLCAIAPFVPRPLRLLSFFSLYNMYFLRGKEKKKQNGTRTRTTLRLLLALHPIKLPVSHNTV